MVKSRYHQRQNRARKRLAKARRARKARGRRTRVQRSPRYIQSKRRPPKIMKLKLDNELDNTLKAKTKSLNETLKNRLSLRKHV